ncbi:hypothetical protein BS50DRAFT_548872 [Corynespora cassiicola Philippines]|uniref:Uncharacterized protein n=1 Tax=Corynespora cassiicola Philippines TaxID=1448308 RepID=A0A2T2NT60_CORCC|nr:hypothetical protein BS50DRAFT_548872 [Corynespora cassiicola Philippines]
MVKLALFGLCAASLTLAADLSDYDPQPGVQAEFKPFLQALVDAAEDPAVTTGYTDYFPPDGMQTTLTIHCVGAAGIQRCKDGFLVGGRQLVHFPNTTSIADNNATATVYDSWGRMESTYTGGVVNGEVINNCSQIYYKTQYTVFKTDQREDAAPNLSLTPQAQVYWYHDYEVTPPRMISDIPCDSLKKRGVPQEFKA